MSELGETFAALKDHKKALRAKYGYPCPVCRVNRPKASASILLPQQICKVDKYRDPRPGLTNEQWEEA